MNAPFADRYEELTARDRAYALKTHEIPIDAQKAIYDVRDGRSASRSYCHYRRAFNGCTDDAANLRDILLGFTYFGSWSNHLDAWNPIARPGTLLVKYEDLLQTPQTQIPRIAEFLRLEPRHPWHNNFEDLARLEPRYFRAAGANRPESALSGSELDLFWPLHGPWMRRLNYAPPDSACAYPEVSDVIREALYRAVAEQTARLNSAEARTQYLKSRVRQLEESRNHPTPAQTAIRA